jgi:hypothetical protein
MAQFAFIVVYFALAGALASWIVGAWFYGQTLRALAAERGQAPVSWLAMIAATVVWPFALGRVKGAAAHAGAINKALVAVLACLTLAVAATSVATNLARVSR